MGSYLSRYNTYLPTNPKHDRYGYKGTDANMQCRNDFQFTLGKWYTHKGKLIPCQSGFHLCKEFNKVFNYYGIHTSRYFIVEYGKNHVISSDKIVTDRIKFIREIEPIGYGSLFLIFIAFLFVIYQTYMLYAKW